MVGAGGTSDGGGTTGADTASVETIPGGSGKDGGAIGC